jgi:perosamine synthetase
MIHLVSPTLDNREIDVVTRVMKTRHLERGNVTLRLEQFLQTSFKSKYAIVMANGTAALFVGLLSYGISEGDEVITTPFSFIATANAICLCGATPVFVDIDQYSYAIDVSRVEKRITKKTKGILVVDLFGHPAQYDELRKIADRHNIHLFSDCCQAIGCLYDNKPVTAFTNFTALSFFNSKNVVSGEGGVLLTNDTRQISLLITVNSGDKSMHIVRSVGISDQRIFNRQL